MGSVNSSKIFVLSLLITIILFLITSFIPYTSYGYVDEGFSGYGFPFPVYGSSITIAGQQPYKIIWNGVFINIVIYFLISALLLFVYNKIKEKSNKK